MLIRTMPSKILLIAVMALAGELDCFAAADDPAAAQKGDRDSDGDGLSDFQEVHKYRTDPAKKVTAGEGTPDGDWSERREFNYSVRAVIRVMPPYNLAALTDDYQDVRVIAETKDYAELEVVIYPLNTCAGAITGNASWRTDYAGMSEFLSPGVTTNWDASMREQLLAELHGSGIDPEKLTDKEVVERVSRWMYSRARHRNMFCTYYVHFPDGKAAIFPGLEQAFEREKGSPDWSVPEQFASELFGKEMFNRKIYGTCTSAAVAQATVLRAVGIPTRLIIAIPLVDASDQEQLALVSRGLRNGSRIISSNSRDRIRKGGRPSVRRTAGSETRAELSPALKSGTYFRPVPYSPPGSQHGDGRDFCWRQKLRGAHVSRGVRGQSLAAAEL